MGFNKDSYHNLRQTFFLERAPMNLENINPTPFQIEAIMYIVC